MKTILLIVLSALLCGCVLQETETPTLQDSCVSLKTETPTWRGFKSDALPAGWMMSDEGVLTHTKGGEMLSQRKSTIILFLNLIGKFQRAAIAVFSFTSVKIMIMFGLAVPKCKYSIMRHMPMA